MIENIVLLQLLAMSEFNVFKLNDISNHHETPVITDLTQIYLSQVTVVIGESALYLRIGLL